MTGETYRTGQASTPPSHETGEKLAGRRGLPRPDRLQRAPRLGSLCLVAMLSTVSASALADPSVFVNENLLDGITQQGVPVLPYNAQATYGGQPGFAAGGASTTIVGTNPDGSQYYVTRPSTLLFPPPRFPRSRVTIIDSGTASSGGTSYSFNSPASGAGTVGTATQSAARLVPPSPTTSTSQKAESRLLVPLPPSISQQAAAPKAPAPKAKAAPQPPKQVARAKAPEPPKVPAPPKKTVPAPKTVAAAQAPKAPAPTAPAAKAPAPKAIAAPPPPKIVPKQLAETAAPKTASVAAAPSTQAPAKSQVTETTASLTPPPPPPPVTPAGAAAAAQPQQQAAAPSQQSASRGDATAQISEVQVLFGSNEAALSGAAKSALENVAQSMLENEASEIQLFAYAGQTGIDATQARRLSLSRAMAVRAFLIGKGIRPARMQVRALGNKTTSGSPDRVDVVPAKR